MKMRPPAIPLISVDPYFNIWSMADCLVGNDTKHWTGKPQRLLGQLIVDGEKYLFMGRGEGIPMVQTNVDLDLYSTYYQFENDTVILKLTFTAPLLPDCLEILCRPINYLHASVESRDGRDHQCQIRIAVWDEICLDKQYDSPTICHIGSYNEFRYASVENSLQNPLCRAGDDVRIEWGRFLLACAQRDAVFDIKEICNESGQRSNQILLTVPVKDDTLIVLAYDDVKSVMYFGEALEGYWKKYDNSILDLIVKAFREYPLILRRCNESSYQILIDAETLGGVKYRELVILAWRQVLAGHKLVEDKKGNLLYISKECFSDGDAATVDITYPSSPMFLMYNPKLLKGMLVPILTLAESDLWDFDCAPHDMGVYPLLNGQAYKDSQGNIVNMPVEECGNMIILMAAYVKASGDTEFAAQYMPLMEQWVRYLEENGEDPEDQLCTDDFAGKSAHNCNLTIKAIMGIASFGLINEMMGQGMLRDKYLGKARQMAQSWESRALNKDGSYRMAFDQPGTFSLKYNMVWDIVFETGLFSHTCIKNELRSYIPRLNIYGIPLDNRETYTKSDWIMWCATMCDSQDYFEKLITPIWKTYHDTVHRIPMGDWYDTISGEMHYYPDLYTGEQIAFQNRTVQGAMLFPLLRASRKLSFSLK